MIERYTRPEMGHLWSIQNEWQTILNVEIAACEAMAELGEIPAAAVENIKAKAKFDVARINEIEKTTDHDIIAFLTNLEENIGEDSKYIHKGLTSSDVKDTAYCVMMRDAAAIILDAHALAGRAELWAPEEAARRWLNALSLVRPGHPGLVVGMIPDALGQALVRWAPTDYADRLLDEREALGFFPATTMVALDGPAAQVRQVAEQVIRDGGADLVGTVVRPATREGEENQVRTLVRSPLAGATSMLAVLTEIRRSRSARKLPLVKMSVNPPELF